MIDTKRLKNKLQIHDKHKENHVFISTILSPF